MDKTSKCSRSRYLVENIRTSASTLSIEIFDIIMKIRGGDRIDYDVSVFLRLEIILVENVLLDGHKSLSIQLETDSFRHQEQGKA